MRNAINWIIKDWLFYFENGRLIYLFASIIFDFYVIIYT